MRLFIAAALACSGCDILFGISPVELPVDAAIDGPPIEITGTLTGKRLLNDSSLRPLVEASPASDAPLVRVGDTPVQVMWEPLAGTFTFRGEGGAVSRLLVGDVEIQSRATTLALDDVVLGRVGATAIAPADKFDVTVTMPPILVGLINISTTGVWSSTVPTDLGTDTFTLEWPKANWSPGQSPARADGSRRDMMYIHAIEGVAVPTPFLRVSHQLALPVTVSGGPQSTTVGIPAITPDACLAITAARGADYTAFQALVPFPIENSKASWSVIEVPRPELGIRWLVGLVAAVGVTDVVAADIHYASPLLGYSLLLALNAEANRTVHGATVTASVATYVPVTRTTSCTPVAISAGLAPVAANPRFGGRAIVDDVIIDLPSGKDPVLTWELARGAADEYSVDLVELEAGRAPRVVRTFRSKEAAIVVDISLFEPGLSYYFSIGAIAASASAPEGDFTHSAPPSAIGTMPTPPFTIRRT